MLVPSQITSRNGDSELFSRWRKWTSFFCIAALTMAPLQTIEPGICVPPHSSFPECFHNLSVRVEDEVLVRQDDYVVLSVDAPKEVVDVESCCQGLLSRS